MNLNSASTLASDLTELDGQPRYVLTDPATMGSDRLSFCVVTEHQLEVFMWEHYGDFSRALDSLSE